MIINPNNLRKSPAPPVKGIYHDVEEKDYKIKSDVLDADGNPTGITNIHTVTKLVPRKLEKDLTIKASDFDVENLADAGINPESIGKPQSFFIHKDSSAEILDIVNVLSGREEDLFEKPKQDEPLNIENNQVVDTIVEPTKQE